MRSATASESLGVAVGGDGCNILRTTRPDPATVRFLLTRNLIAYGSEGHFCRGQLGSWPSLDKDRYHDVAMYFVSV